ncbi:hypothetical protein, partial [Providencia sp. PROV121]|uniref:hypothetical protein n=1 Tax=Providencia sp. PROV121 TaxID=2949832 RepID=UPI00234B1176
PPSVAPHTSALSAPDARSLGSDYTHIPCGIPRSHETVNDQSYRNAVASGLARGRHFRSAAWRG